MLLQKNIKGQNNHVSVVKGIAILFIVWGHATIHVGIPGLSRFSTFLILPLFVLVSGYCFKDYYLTHRLSFVKRRIKTLYWPFVKWAAIFVLLHNLFCHIGFYPADEQLYTWKDLLEKIPHILVMHSPEVLIGANWFITELFFGALVFILFARWINKYPLAGVVGFAIIAVIMHITGFHVRLRDVTMMTVSYYTMGFWMRGRTLSHHWLVILSLLVITVLGSLTVYGNFHNINPRWLIPNYAVVLASAWMFTAIAWHIANHDGWLTRILAYIGNRTLIILTLHFTAMRIISWALACYLGLPHECISEHPVIHKLVWAWPLYFIAGVIFPLAFDYLDKLLWKQLKKGLNKHLKE